MVPNVTSRPKPVRARVTWILVAVTFVALCAAFFAGVLHQTDSQAVSHESATTQLSVDTVADSIDDGVALAPFTTVTAGDGWLTALVTACAIFVLWSMTLLFRRLLPKPERPVGDVDPASVVRRAPVLNSLLPQVSILLRVSISRT